MSWIKTKDKMPEEDTPVLVYGEDYNGVRIQSVYEYYGGGHWSVSGAVGYEYEESIPSVTHWQPLPEPPGE